MTCRTVSLGGATGIVCYRGPRRDPVLLCDGCDSKIAVELAVSPKQGVDFCPKCFDRPWRHWLATVSVPESRGERRAQFRAWALKNPELFLSMVPLSAEGHKAVSR